MNAVIISCLFITDNASLCRKYAERTKMPAPRLQRTHIAVKRPGELIGDQSSDSPAKPASMCVQIAMLTPAEVLPLRVATARAPATFHPTFAARALRSFHEMSRAWCSCDLR